MSETVRLNLFETRALYTLDTRPAGVYEIRISPQSNSMYSTLFLSALDAGATITVEYRESTTGDAEGEDYLIAAHLIPTAGPSGVSKLTVAPHHNKPRLMVTVAGGAARFGIYVTPVSSFAVDFSQALVHDAAVLDLTKAGGLIGSIYDPADGKAYFARGTHGVLNVNVIPPPSGTQKSIFNEILLVASGSTQRISSYTVPFGRIAKLQRVEMSGDNIATFDVKINTLTFSRKRTYFGGPYTAVSELSFHPLAAGDLVEVYVYNFRNTVGNFEARIQYIEV